MGERLPENDRPAELRCTCGCRRLVHTLVLNQSDGGPAATDTDVLACPACNRAYVCEPDTALGHGFRLRLVLSHASVQGWRNL